jgi:hypothetical protein
MSISQGGHDKQQGQLMAGMHARTAKQPTVPVVLFLLLQLLLLLLLQLLLLLVCCCCCSRSHQVTS